MAQGRLRSFATSVFDHVSLVFYNIAATIGISLGFSVSSNTLILIFLWMPTFFDFMISVSHHFQALIFVNRIYWVLGIIFFGIALLFFIVAFSSNGEPWFFSRLVPLIVFGIIIVPYLFTGCDFFKEDLVVLFVIIVYSLAEIVFVWRAMSRVGFNNPTENIMLQWLVAIGAMLFLLADILHVALMYCPAFPQVPISSIYYLGLYYPGMLMMALGSDRFGNFLYFFQNTQQQNNGINKL